LGVVDDANKNRKYRKKPAVIININRWDVETVGLARMENPEVAIAEDVVVADATG
jgi:hypothetical protein